MERAIVLLPALPDSVAEVDGACHLCCGELLFVVPEGKAAFLTLRGIAQWGLPGPDGVFVLGPEPILREWI